MGGNQKQKEEIGEDGGVDESLVSWLPNCRLIFLVMEMGLNGQEQGYGVKIENREEEKNQLMEFIHDYISKT